ncbi:hypothetical protein WG922_20075 [Ramlibacter sp. AN1015]|uniref:hypothetical protein n=1 Tax=Ramlibacter sp. AN1015 TaxID=3133428 RepID=UPI0030BC1BFE
MAHLRHLATQPPTVRPLPASLTRLGCRHDSWSQDVLGDFSLRMANHGLSVSSSMMGRDPGYALEQLRHARGLEDDGLRQLAEAMVRDFARRQTGVKALG